MFRAPNPILLAEKIVKQKVQAAFFFLAVQYQ